MAGILPAAGGYGAGEGGVGQWDVVTAFETEFIKRLLMVVRMGPTFRNLVAQRAGRTEALLAIAEQIRAAFDLDTAVGVQLDRLGEILQRRRLGLSDDRYRIVLQIQVQLILASQSTTANILKIVELYTGQLATHYGEHYPMGFSVGGVVAAADTPLLVQLLNEARAAAYNGTLLALEPGDGSGNPEDDPGPLIVEMLPYPQDDPPVSTQALAVRDFDGVDDEIVWSSVQDLTTSPITIAFWLYIDALPDAPHLFRIEPGDGQYFRVGSTNGSLQFVSNNTGGGTVLVVTTDIGLVAPGQWYHIAVTWDGGDEADNVHIYVDGIEVTYGVQQDRVGTPRTIDGDWVLGSNSSGTLLLDGRIADERVWSAELTPDEIWLEYLSTGAPVRSADLVFNPDLATLNDPISGLDGTADGTELLLDEPVPDIDVMDYAGDPIPGAGLMGYAIDF